MVVGDDPYCMININTKSYSIIQFYENTFSSISKDAQEKHCPLNVDFH